MSSTSFAQEDKPENIAIELLNRIDEEDDKEKALILADELLKLGREQGDSTIVSWGFYTKYDNSPKNESIHYLDSIIYSTINSLKIDEPTFGYILKAEHYYQEDDFNKALDSYIIANQYAKNKKDQFYERITTSGIAGIKSLTRENAQALQMYYKVKNLLIKEDLNKPPHIEYVANLYNIAACHYALKNKDSLNYYSRLGLNSNDEKGNHIYYPDFLRLNGMANYLMDNNKKAIDSLKKSISISKDSVDLPSALYVLSLAHSNLKRKDSSTFYLNLIDELDVKPELYFPEIKDVYYQLFKYAEEENNQRDQIKYLEKFLIADSILQSLSAPLSRKINEDFDVPLLKKEKNRLKKLQNEINYSSILIYMLILICSILSYFYIKYVKTKKRIKDLIDNPSVNINRVVEKEANKNQVESNAKNSLPHHVQEEIVLYLKKFEDSHGYLDNGIRLSILATRANTNTAYLSAYLTNEKGGYTEYIKNLRVQYAYSDLTDDKENLKYTLLALAEKYGFKSTRAFNEAFKGVFNVTPKQLLDELRKS